jgi:hypothetical protein
MFKEHQAVRTPPDQTVIWRYLDMHRFLALLHDSALYLCRADKFPDPWEGVWPNEVLVKLRLYAQSKGIANLLERAKTFNYVSCWHIGSVESAALWGLYASSGIAVRSTVGRLKQSLTDDKAINIGEVSYIDFDSWTGQGGLRGDLGISLLAATYLKRESFRHEHELRVVYYNPPTNLDSVDPAAWPVHHSLSVDLNELIESVYISPLAPAWLVEPVRSICSKFGVRADVRRSTLYDPRVL